MVRLSVENEDFSDKEGLAGYSEHLFDTPSAVARVWRSGDYRREMTISAQETRDPNDRELRFDWALLRGDPAKVRITPLDAAGTRARIEVDWHDPWTLPGPPPRETSRVDIGVFASNGVHASAPAIVSVSFPTHQKRVYAPVAGEMRLRQIDYSPGIQGAYYDPVLHWAADWRDRFDYDASGQIIGWLRETGDETLTLRGPGISVDLDYRVETFDSGPKLRMLPKSQAAE